MDKLILKAIPYGMPLGPAIVLSMTIYLSLVDTWPGLAAPVAITLSVLFESAGYLVAHNFSMQVEAKNTGKSFTAGLFLIGFVIAAVSVVVFGHEAIGNKLLVAILAAFPLVSCIVYLSQAMMLTVNTAAQEAQAERQVQLDREQAEWRQSQDIKRKREEARIDKKYGQGTGQSQATTQNVDSTGHVRSLSGGLQAVNDQARLSKAERQKEVKLLYKKGMTQVQIAAALNVGPRTIRRDVANLGLKEVSK